MVMRAGYTLGGETAVAQFGLRVRGVPDQAFTVATFETTDLRLNGHYAFHVEAVSTLDFVGLDELVDSPATLWMRWEGRAQHLNGIVSSVEYTGETPDGPAYRLEVRSLLHPMTLQRNNRIFLGAGVTAIARQVLEGAGVPGEALHFEIGEEPPAREFVVQYDETDLEFLERQLAYHGLVFAFEQGPDRARLLVTDDAGRLSDRLGTVTLDYAAASGQVRNATTIYEWSPRAQRTSRGVRLRDYNPEAPQRRLEAQAGDGAEDYRYGEHYGERGEGQRLARVRHETHAWQAGTVRARTDCRAVAPGGCLALDGYPGSGADGEWLIVAADLAGDQRSGFAYGRETDGATFEAALTLIPADVPYREPARRSSGRAAGMFTARVEGDGGAYACIDDGGRYRIRMPFDLSDRADAEASHPVRMAQPYGGSGHGMHFPLHHGTEVLVGFANGDLDRPVILGAVYNADSPSPVNGSNPTQNVLRSWAGNELLMEDRAGAERVELFTPERRNRLALDAAEQGHEVTLESSDGDLRLRAGANLNSEAGRDQHTEIGGKQQVTVRKGQRLLTKEGDLGYQAGKDFSLKARENVHLEATRANLTARAGKDFRLRAGQGVNVEVRKRDARLKVTQGSVTLQAAKAMTFRGEGGGPIRIGQAGSTIEITDSGDLSIDAKKVEITGGSIAIKGGSVGNNG